MLHLAVAACRYGAVSFIKAAVALQYVSAVQQEPDECMSAPHLDSHQLVLVQPAVHHSIAPLACMQRHALPTLESWAITSTAMRRPATRQPGEAWKLLQPHLCQNNSVWSCGRCEFDLRLLRTQRRPQLQALKGQHAQRQRPAGARAAAAAA